MKSLAAVTIASLLTVAMLHVDTQSAPEGSVSPKLIKHYENDLKEQGNTKGTINAVTNNDIKALSLDREKLITHNKLFSHKLESAGITNQKSSGRCWLFASLNVFSLKVKEQLKLDKFEFSQPFLTFWDKMEKANIFLEEI
ncbi:MAG: C1 family peptidase, partial [candidate division Zixibacteria bacterium]|nr:C1 family peptidase [candidate division Zixibacteria bacterium]